ncbi:MAG: cyclase family protein [Acidobacteria bacterium]|jgi:arylformamidase|nr:MAG: cyclase family protein [Acidobacteriota bacterium]GIU81522.1 MAG: cyclase [Pyrinomonadaceae bacterium]
MMIYDITVPIFDCVPIYEGDPAVKISTYASITEGSAANVTHLCFGTHTATHVDAPSHFIEGARKLHELELEKLIGKCRVIHLPEEVFSIQPEHLGNLQGVERVIFKTRNSQFWNEPHFRRDFTHLSFQAAEKLIEAEIKLIGIDYLSIEKFGEKNFPVHKLLLEKEIVILEGLDLRKVSAGDYELICLPMKIISPKGDGAPARAILRSLNE